MKQEPNDDNIPLDDDTLRIQLLDALVDDGPAEEETVEVEEDTVEVKAELDPYEEEPEEEEPVEVDGYEFPEWYMQFTVTPPDEEEVNPLEPDP